MGVSPGLLSNLQSSKVWAMSSWLNPASICHVSGQNQTNAEVCDARSTPRLSVMSPTHPPTHTHTTYTNARRERPAWYLYFPKEE